MDNVILTKKWNQRERRKTSELLEINFHKCHHDFELKVFLVNIAKKSKTFKFLREEKFKF